MAIEEEFFKPAVFGKAVGRFVFRTIYNSPDVGLREMIANSADQYLDLNKHTCKHFKEIDIEVNKITRTLKDIDYATGIVTDLEKFQQFFADDKDVKTVGSQVSTLDNPHAEMIGVYHVGKGSYFKMSDRETGKIAQFRSNNGKEGLTFHMMLRGEDDPGWDREYRYQQRLCTEAKPEIGLTVEVYDVVEELLKPSRIVNLISKWFGIRIKRGLKITVTDTSNTITRENPIRVQAPADLDTANEIKTNPALKLSSGQYVTYCLKHKAKPKYENIDVYVKHVFIKSIHVDCRAEGWINCDDFKLTGARDAFQTGGREGAIYKEGMAQFEIFAVKEYGKQEKERVEITGQTEMNKYLQNILEEAVGLFPEDQVILAGVPNRAGVKGNVIDDVNDKERTERVDNVKIIKTGGDPSDPVKVIGPGHKRDGPRSDVCGPDDEEPEPGDPDYRTYVEGEGKRSIIRCYGETKPKTGPVKPSIRFSYEPLVEEDRMSVMNSSSTVILNTNMAPVQQLLTLALPRRLPLMGYLAVDAITEYISRDKNLTVEQYRKKQSALLAKVWIIK
jgi:hypothetical protein